MREINQDDVPILLTQCHGALMGVWNKYRSQLNQHGIETIDAIQEVTIRVLSKLHEFKPKSDDISLERQFCAWTKVILVHWILDNLRKDAPVHLSSDLSKPDDVQERPSETFQVKIRRAAYTIGKAELPEHERTLIELRYEEELSIRDLSDRLRNDYPSLWEDHKLNWSTPYKLNDACLSAKSHLNANAQRIYRTLESGFPLQ